MYVGYFISCYFELISINALLMYAISFYGSISAENNDFDSEFFEIEILFEF